MYGGDGNENKNMKTLSIWLRRILGVLLLIVVAWHLWVLGWVLWWKWANPGETSFMAIRLSELREKDPQAQLRHQWVAYEKISATRRAREYAEAALEAEQSKLSVGNSTQFTVLQLQKNLTSARSDEWSALADYSNALSTLRQKEASSLEFRNINLAR